MSPPAAAPAAALADHALYCPSAGPAPAPNPAGPPAEEEEEAVYFFLFFYPNVWAQIGSEIEGGEVVPNTSVNPRSTVELLHGGLR